MADLPEQTKLSFEENGINELDYIPENERLTLKKEARLIKLKTKLVNNVHSKNFRTITDKVAFILNKSSSSRNSDAMLAWEYWSEFESEIFNGTIESSEDLRKLTKIPSLCRARAKIQNEYHLYEASQDVKRFRGKLSEAEKQNSVDSKPEGLGNYTVYIDETGKNDKNLIIGSLWINFIDRDYLSKNKFLEQWKKSKNINYEFHFSKISKHQLDEYIEFFDIFLKIFTTACFKVIHVSNKGISNTEAAISELTYHVISKGINHEQSTGRATLPRILNVYIDPESPGSDSIKLATVRKQLENEKIDGLHLQNFDIRDSKDSLQIQVVDLFAAAMNRKMNHI